MIACSAAGREDPLGAKARKPNGSVPEWEGQEFQTDRNCQPLRRILPAVDLPRLARAEEASLIFDTSTENKAFSERLLWNEGN